MGDACGRRAHGPAGSGGGESKGNSSMVCVTRVSFSTESRTGWRKCGGRMTGIGHVPGWRAMPRSRRKAAFASNIHMRASGRAGSRTGKGRGTREPASASPVKARLDGRARRIGPTRASSATANRTHGQGIETSPFGGTSYDEGKRHSQGVLATRHMGSRYEGGFRDGDVYGQGVMTWSLGRGGRYASSGKTRWGTRFCPRAS